MYGMGNVEYSTEKWGYFFTENYSIDSMGAYKTGINRDIKRGKLTREAVNRVYEERKKEIVESGSSKDSECKRKLETLEAKKVWADGRFKYYETRKAQKTSHKSTKESERRAYELFFRVRKLAGRAFRQMSKLWAKIGKKDKSSRKLRSETLSDRQGPDDEFLEEPGYKNPAGYEEGQPSDVSYDDMPDE